MANAAGSGQIPTAHLTRLDRVIAAVAPSFALKRYEARVRMDAAVRIFGPGGYNGARGDRQATRNWNPMLDGPNSATVPDVRPLRARAADLERNDPIASSAVETTATATVGTGIRAHARVNREYLKLDDDAADALDRRIDFIVAAHAERKAWDLETRNDFYGQQDLALRAVLSRGDAIVVRRFVERPGDLLATRFQLIEGDRLSTPFDKFDTDQLIDGVALDADNCPQGYYIQDQHPGDARFMGIRTWTFVPARGTESGSWRVLHVYRMKRAGQVRGVPFLAPVIEQLKQVSRLSEAELMASVVNSLFTVFVKSESGELDLPDMEAGAPGIAQNPPPHVNDDRKLSLGSGLAIGLLPGESIEVADPKRPNAQYDPFFSAIVGQIGAALEIPGDVLLKRFNASYSASRAALLEFWRAVTTRRRWLVRDLCAPCREAVIEEAVARGLIDAPGFFTDPLARAAYCAAEWTGPAMGQLNPLDEAAAAAKRVAEGFTTIAEETAQLTGGDFERNHAQRTKEHRMRVGAGLEPEVLGITTRALVPEPPPPTDESDPGAPALPSPSTPAPKQLPSPKKPPTEEPNAIAESIASLAHSVVVLAERPAAPMNVSVAPPAVTVNQPPMTFNVDARRTGGGVVTESKDVDGTRRFTMHDRTE